MKYLRIRESGGNTYWDYSANGIGWTNLTSASNPITVTALYVQWGIYADEDNYTLTVDDFNILPTSQRIIITN